MTEFDVLAVRGYEAETLHCEIRGAVPPGSRIDIPTGYIFEVIGRVAAADAAAAHAAACAEFL